MLKIAIDEQDSIFRHGVETLLKDIFSIYFNKSIAIETLNEFNFIHSDVIIKSFDNGMKYICQPLVKDIKPNCLIIGFYNGNEISRNIPSCFSRIIFIKRSESVFTIKRAIMWGWQKYNLRVRHYDSFSCIDCVHFMFTSQQALIAKYIYRGFSQQQTAEAMSLNSKTVCAHKRAMMNKLDLSTDCELLNFLNTLLESKYPSEAIKKSLT